ncbi:MAG: deoxyribodipyrimidine photo-lyase [Chthonomonas sp.]|nr:deoxyribodipyrimidine photo-lyase [Chthonomonas sp.]
MSTALFVFRRDLRLEDNTGLNHALTEHDRVIPVFCIDPRQVEPHAYRSVFGLAFLRESLVELDESLKKVGSKLHVLVGVGEAEIPRLAQLVGAERVVVNRDYTPFARARDAEFDVVDDALLTVPETSVKPDGLPYTVFTPFYKKNSLSEPPRPHPLVNQNLFSVEGAFGIEKVVELMATPGVTPLDKPGRRAGLEILAGLGRLTEYNETRDVPAIEGTSRLSPHHKFGTVSIRESYWAAREQLPPSNRLITEFYWRDFMTCIGFHFPHVFEGNFNPMFDGVEWDDNPEWFEFWREGRTGFPIVDAGMRELAATGFMHNRTRMIVASFLTKDCHIHWREGERHFATLLTDYDPCVNNGSWQWAASTGCDAQPYFRIFNPWLQQVKFDPDAVYIRRWIPELEHVATADIHNPERSQMLFGYPAPMLDHAHEKAITLAKFEAAKSKFDPSKLNVPVALGGAKVGS